MKPRWLRWAGLLMLAGAARAELPHSVVIEAESLSPLKGANFSFQKLEQTTKGTWSLAGPGVAAEWTQGGESEFLSVAARHDEAAEISIGREIELPASGNYTLHVRYMDYRRKEEAFGVRIKQGGKTHEFGFGRRAKIDEFDPMLLRWDFAFAWDRVEVGLEKGMARIELHTTGPTEARRHVDVMVLTTDASYRPSGRAKPDAAAWKVLREIKRSEKVEALAASRGGEVPATWRIGEGKPWFVWNVGKPWLDELKKADGMHEPFGLDPPVVKDFLEAYRGKKPPIFGEPVSGPVWHIPSYPEVFADGSPFLAWLEKNPARPFSILLNYGDPSWPKDANKQAVHANFSKYKDRFMGYISGESISHTGIDESALDAKVKAAKSRAEVLSALREAHTAAVVKKLSDYYGKAVTPAEAWADVISCLSANNEAFTHAVVNWGEKRGGHENTGNSPTLARRLAFLRGAARQFGAKFADYQSANLGDSATMFSREHYIYPANARYILDNSYDAFAGAGVNWLLKDYLLFYLGGCDVFYNEQGVDLFWRPGGHAAGDSAPLQLSPKGKVAEAVVQLAQKHPRGTQYTPIAFLLDEAHGWSQERFAPGAFGMDCELNPAVLTPGRHEASIRGWFDIAYFPAPETQNEPASGIRQTYVNGIFGDIFDVIVTAPGKTAIAATYPVIVAAGEVPLSEEWGKALAAYVENGGTLVGCAEQFIGPGALALGLPKLGEPAEAAAFVWRVGAERRIESNVFRYRSPAADGARVLAATENRSAIAVMLNRGKGRLIVVGVPMGLGIDQRPTPVAALLMRHLAEGVVPIKMEGDVEWIVNRLPDGGWLVGLLNNRGVIKPQHGVLPTDHSQEQTVTLRVPFEVAKSEEWMVGQKVEFRKEGTSASGEIKVPAGGVRLVAIYP